MSLTMQSGISERGSSPHSKHDAEVAASGSVLLLSMPWSNHRSPSIQIAALKAFLETHQIKVFADHFFLRVADWLGPATYAEVWGTSLEDAESLYGAMLFPEHRPTILQSHELACKALVAEAQGKHLPIPSEDFFIAFAEFHERELDRFDFSSITLVGLTLNFGQTLASAYIAERIKARAPHVKVVIGGAEATDVLGRSLLGVFQQFDFACSGEGEQALLALVRAMPNDAWGELPPSITVRGREGHELGSEVSVLGQLPVPDFSDYFNAVDELGYDQSGICAYIPFETSRGCYYSCSFCSLNLQWNGYRQASPDSISDKITILRKKYSHLNFFFVDNITPIGVSKIAERLISHQVDYRLFYEARVNLKRETWRLLAQAGLRTVQLGIEALSDDLLKIYHKKSTVLHNLQALKYCYEFGINVIGNIITNHPLAREEHVAESLENLDFVKAFPPALDTSEYALMVGSPDFANGLPGVEKLGNHEVYARAYPSHILDKLDLPRKAFSKSSLGGRADFSPLITAIGEWAETYSRHQMHFGGREPVLSYQDGGDFLNINDWRSGRLISFQLDESERKVFLATAEAARTEEIMDRTGIDRTWIEGALSAFAKERLVYFKDDRALGLPIRRSSFPR